MATNIEFVKQSDGSVLVSATGMGIAGPVVMHPRDYQVTMLSATQIILKPLNGGFDLLPFTLADVTTPAAATIQDLFNLLNSVDFFFDTTSGIVFSGTYAEVIARESTGTLPNGLVKITDREGGVVLTSVGSVLSTTGTALFYDINWSGVDEWAATAISGTITYTLPSGGPVAPGTPLAASGGWTGVSILDNGTNTITAYQTSTGFAWPGNGETLGDGGVFSVTVSSSIPPVIETLAWYLAPDGYHVYGVTDVEQLDGTDPATNVAAWSIVPGGAISAAFTKSTSAIEFDKYNAMGGDPGIVVRRNNGVVDATYTYAMDQIFGMGYSALGLIKWGDASQDLWQSAKCADPAGWHHGRTAVSSAQILAWHSSIIPIIPGTSGACYPEYVVVCEFTGGTIPYTGGGLMFLSTGADYFGPCDANTLIGQPVVETKYCTMSNYHGASQITPLTPPAIAAQSPSLDGIFLGGEEAFNGDGTILAKWKHTLSVFGQ